MTNPNFIGLSASIVLLVTIALVAPGMTGGVGKASAQAVPAQQAETMRIRINVGDKAIDATLADNETARDFASLLPLTLTMDDLFGREKTALLPRAISTAGPRSYSYEVGDVILWSPRPSVEIFYRHDGQTIPSPGSIPIAKADAGVQALDVPGSVTVTITRLED